MLYKSNNPEGRVKEFLEQSEGYCIEYDGFDSILWMIGNASHYELPTKDQFVDDAGKRHDQLANTFLKLMKEYAEQHDYQKLNNPIDNEIVESLNQALDTTTVDKYSDAIWHCLLDEYEDALTIFTELISEEPDNAEYHYSMGVTLHAMKRYEEALTEAQKAVELEPENTKYRDSMNITLYELKGLS